MIYVGIDIAKLNHFASAVSSEGEELIKPFKFTNDADGFQLLSSHLDSLPVASNCCPLIWILFRMTASSSVLSQRPTTATTSFVSSLMKVIRSVSLTRSRPRPSEKTTSERQRRIRLTPTSLRKHLCCSSLIGLSLSLTST